jgi:hypothetical protein
LNDWGRHPSDFGKVAGSRHSLERKELASHGFHLLIAGTAVYSCRRQCELASCARVAPCNVADRCLRRESHELSQGRLVRTLAADGSARILLTPGKTSATAAGRLWGERMKVRQATQFPRTIKKRMKLQVRVWLYHKACRERSCLVIEKSGYEGVITKNLVHHFTLLSLR